MSEEITTTILDEVKTAMALGADRAAATGMPVEELERYGRYVLIERIGRGGMAEVWKAVSEGAEGFQRLSVVKRVRPDRASDSFYVKSFCDEARVCALLNHPNLVHVHEFGEIAGTHFLAMEYLSGRDLGSIGRVLKNRGERLPTALAVYVAMEVAQGLAYAHALTGPAGKPLNLVHRDVSPGNIMLLFTGGVKLVDFGVARADDPLRACVTHGRLLKGKATHMSPEQILSRKLDARSDIFSLGVVLWEMLTGQPLFRAIDDFETMRQVLKKPIDAPSTITAGLPAELDAICALALARDPAQRYQSAERLAHDLEEILRGMTFRRADLPAFLRQLFGTPVGEHPGAIMADVGERRTSSERVAVLMEAQKTAPKPVPAAVPRPSTSERLVRQTRELLTAARGHRRALELGVMLGAAVLLIVAWKGRTPPRSMTAAVHARPSAPLYTALPMAQALTLPAVTIASSPPTTFARVSPQPVAVRRERPTRPTALRPPTLARSVRPSAELPELHVDPFAN